MSPKLMPPLELATESAASIMIGWWLVTAALVFFAAGWLIWSMRAE